MGQKPITFIRQVVSLVSYPELLNSKEFPEDAKSRARAILDASRGSAGNPSLQMIAIFYIGMTIITNPSDSGCYSDSAGLEIIRKHVAQYIERRDGFPSNPNDIVLCAGASEGIRVKLRFPNQNSSISKN